MADRSVGRHIADAFHLVPSGSDPGFADAMLDVVERESVDAILPQSSFDLLGLAEAKARFEGVAVMVSSPEAIRRSNDKAESYALLDEIGVPGPRWRRVVGGEAVAEAARELGYPGEDVAIKPAFSSGSRGFRILSAGADRREQLLKNRPGVAEALRLEELVELLGDDETPLARDGARLRARADDRRDRGRRPNPARPPEDARVDARRARHVLRDPRRPLADGDLGQDRGGALASTTSSTSSSSATR